MTPDLLPLIQLAVIVGGVSVFGVFLSSMVRADSRHGRRHLERWADRARQLGFQVTAEHDDARVQLEHRVDGIGVVLAGQVERGYRGKHRYTKTRAVVSTVTPCPWADAAIVKQAPELFGLGHLTEVQLEPWFTFRTFASRPHEVSRWLHPETRAAIVAARNISSVAIQGRRVSVVLDGMPEPEGAVAAMQMAAAIHRGVASTAPARPLSMRRPRLTPHLLPAVGATILASVAGFSIPWHDDVEPTVSPLACEEGGIQVVGSNKKTFWCVDEDFRGPMNPLAIPALASLFGTPTFVLTYLVLLAVTKATARPEDSA